ncbi:hypothetical protein CSV71_15080 [Sporosarcina sp. P21c]|uniref:hypothetical protein n=1 Tax=unclassified Sporosarcina TaxID=2647733 RepID=UPI000C16C42B|nr:MULTISPECIES: hypothetical protein [unclassified Sporosarcina]PIC82495.1 hypothetical protein CSV73_11750 [Sporosarcina sp. P1]PIC88367.1 hypothetical protein CSV71_15080 [Sporosarcina sp. P21c]
MKIKPFWAIMLTVVLIWVANYIYAEKHKLERPVFLNHYLDLNLKNEQYIPFYFITNKDDTSFIQFVELGNIRGIPDRFGENEGVEVVEQFGRYSLKRVNIQFDPEAFVTSGETVKFDNMVVHFSGNEVATYSIGQIVFQYQKEQWDPLSFKSGSVGEYSETRLNAKEALTIESVDTVFDDALQDQFLIKLHSANGVETEQLRPVLESDEWNHAKGIDLREMNFPLQLAAGAWLNVKSYADPALHAVLDVKIDLNGTTEAGESFVTRVGHLHYYPYMTKESIRQVIEDRTEVKAHE